MKATLEQKNKYRCSPERVIPMGDHLAGAARPARVDQRSGGMTDGIRGIHTCCCTLDGIRGLIRTHTCCCTSGGIREIHTSLLRSGLLDSGTGGIKEAVGLQQVLEVGIRESDMGCMADGIMAVDTSCMAGGIRYPCRKFDAMEASLDAQVKLENLAVRWEDEKQQYRKALVQVSEHLEHIGDGLIEVRKSLNGLSRQTAEIGKLDKKIQQGEERLQELFVERVHLKERSTTLRAEVKSMEDEIKRRFLDPKPVEENACVGTLGRKEDRTMRIGALWLEEANICRIGAVSYTHLTLPTIYSV